MLSYDLLPWLFNDLLPGLSCEFYDLWQMIRNLWLGIHARFVARGSGGIARDL